MVPTNLLSILKQKNQEEESKKSCKEINLDNKEIKILEIVHQNLFSPKTKHFEPSFIDKKNPFLQTSHFLQIVNNSQWNEHQINLKKINNPLYQKESEYKKQLMILLSTYQDYEPRYMIELFISIMNPLGYHSVENPVIISEIKQSLFNLLTKLNQRILLKILVHKHKLDEEEIDILKKLLCSMMKLEEISNAQFSSELNDFKNDLVQYLINYGTTTDFDYSLLNYS